MKNIGIVSYNIRGNFTNYGSALQSWALSKTIERIGENKYRTVLIDYCPNKHIDSNPLNPFEKMWDKDEETIEMCKLSLPAIEENYYKFEDFYNNRFNRTKKAYNYKNFNSVVEDENIDFFVCGSDTIFCVDEFGIDDGYYANYECMKNKSISYAASFGDSHFDEKSYEQLNKMLKNFNAISLREEDMLSYVKQHTDVEVKRVIDPTLLLEKDDYDKIAAPRLEEEKYLLLYSRRLNNEMNEYAEKLAKENGWKIIEISLQAKNASKHRMFYEAGVEEFLSLVKNAEFVVTNSYHGMIFSIQFEKEFIIFSREQCDTKIKEVLDILELSNRMAITKEKVIDEKIDFKKVKNNLKKYKENSLLYLQSALNKMT